MRLADIAITHLRRRKSGFVFLVVGLTIGVSTVVALLTLTRTMDDEVSRTLDEFGANILMVPRSDALSLSYGGLAVSGVAVEAERLDRSAIDAIHRIKNSESISIVAPKALYPVQVQQKTVLVAGVVFPEEFRLKKWWRVQGAQPAEDHHVLVGSEAAIHLGLRPGDRVDLEGYSFQVTGVLEETGSQDDGLIFADLDMVQQRLRKDDTLNLIEVAALCNTCPIEDIVQQISETLPQAKVTAIKQAVQSKMDTIEQFRMLSGGIAAIVMIVGGLIVLTTMMGSVNERTREIGVLRAIGFRQSSIVRMLLFEAAVVGLIGGVLGWFTGHGAAVMVAPQLLSGGDVTVPFDSMLGLWAMGLSVSVGMLAGLYPALRAARLDPTVALRAL